MASRHDYIQILREFPARLEARVTPLTDEQLDQREADGEWTTRQIVHHLADSHISANFLYLPDAGVAILDRDPEAAPESGEI